MKKLSNDELFWIAKKINIYTQNAQASKLKTYKKSNSSKANINFYSQKKSNAKNNLAKTLSHNKRQDKDQDYFLPHNEREKNEYLDLEKDLNLVELDKKVRNDYLEFHKRKMPYNAQTTTEAILNITEKHNCADVLKAIEKLNLPMKPLQISIHRDEGHYNQLTQNYEKNYHAHIVFLNYDFEKHRTLKRTMSKKDFSELPKKLSEALKMELNEGKKQGYHLNRFQLEHRFQKQAERTLESLKQEHSEAMLKKVFKNSTESEKQDLLEAYGALLDLTSKNKGLDFLEQINNKFPYSAKCEIEANIKRAKEKDKTLKEIDEDSKYLFDDIMHKIKWGRERIEIESSIFTNLTRKARGLTNKEQEQEYTKKIEIACRTLTGLASNDSHLKEIKDINLIDSLSKNSDPLQFHKKALEIINKKIEIAKNPQEYIADIKRKEYLIREKERKEQELAEQKERERREQERKKQELEKEREQRRQQEINKAIEKRNSSDRELTRGRHRTYDRNHDIEL